MNRICPKCGKTIEYSTKKIFDQAVKRNNKCLSCGRSRDVAGEKNPFWGKKHNQEIINDIIARNTGKKLSIETRQKMSAGRQKENNANWKGDFLKRKCETCGAEFRSSDGRARYCIEHRVEAVSGERNCNWNGGKIPVTLKCKCCEKEFVVTTTQMRSGRKFCSHSCSNIEKNKHNKMFDTDIEIAVEGYLAKNGVGFKKQVPLHGITLADFVVGDRLVIQCDGVYWHSREGYVERDIRQDTKLVSLGYKVIRVSDIEIKQGVDSVMSRKMKDIVNNDVVSWRQGVEND